MRSVKIFGIGLSRTGTTTLCYTMKVLGFKAIHYPKSLQEIDAHTFSNDTPVSARFELLDQMYPDTKFIYTTRDIDKWVLSCLKWWFPQESRLSQIKSMPAELKQWYDYGDVNLYGHDMLGLAHITKEKLVQAYYTYDKRVKNYFKNRPSDLLIIDVTRADLMPLTKLVRFLEQHRLIGLPCLNGLNAVPGGSNLYGESSTSFSLTDID